MVKEESGEADGQPNDGDKPSGGVPQTPVMMITQTLVMMVMAIMLTPEGHL